MNTPDESLQKWNRLVFIYRPRKIASILTCIEKLCLFNFHCRHVFRSLLNLKMAKKCPIASVPMVTRSVLQKPKRVWGKSLRWQLGQRFRLRSVARRALAFCYRFWQEWKLPLSTCRAQPPTMLANWEIRGKDPEELNFSLPSYSQQMKVFGINLIGFYRFAISLYVWFGVIPVWNKVQSI